MIEVTRHIWLVNPPVKPIYPYSNSLYIEDDIPTMIDAGTGGRAYSQIQKGKIQTILLTHFHFDHVHSDGLFSQARLLAGQEEQQAYINKEKYLAAYGYDLWESLMPGIIRQSYDNVVSIPDDIEIKPGFRHIKIADTFQDMDIITTGKYTVQTIHLPGHTWGHYGFYIEKSGLLFSGDINLGNISTWYSNKSADIGDLIYSVNKIKEINPAIVVPSHRPILDVHIPQMAEQHIQIILDRNSIIYDLLKTPHTLHTLAAQNIIFPKHRSMYDLFWEKISIRNHIRYFLGLGLIHEIEPNMYQRI